MLLKININHYPFGSPMPNRKYQSSSPYRYGFNGKENDNETVTTGEGTQDYGMRIYNPCLGKFLSSDPLTSSYPWYTSYQFAGNKPIWCTDLDGLEENFKPLEKYKYGEETDLKTTTANYVMTVPNAATNIANSIGSLFSLIVYNVSELARSPEDYVKEVKDYWSHSKEDIHQIKVKVQELAENPSAILEPLKGAQGIENILTIGAQVTMVAKTPVEFSSEANYATQNPKISLEQATLEYKNSSTVVRAELPNGANAVAPSGTPPSIVAKSLEIESSKIGGVGAKNGGNTVGCCSEFQAANKLLLENPKFGPKDIKFTPTIRPRTGQVIPKCENCISIFGKDVKEIKW